MSETIEIYIDRAGEFRWKVQAANGKIVGDSAEGYQHLTDCEDEAKKLFPDIPVKHNFAEEK